MISFLNAKVSQKGIKSIISRVLMLCRYSGTGLSFKDTSVLIEHYFGDYNEFLDNSIEEALVEIPSLNANRK